MKSVSGSCPAFGTTLQEYAYVCANRVGQSVLSSSRENLPFGPFATTDNACGSNAFPCDMSLIDASIGLMPHDSDVNEAVVGSDRFPSLSTTITEAVHVPEDTSARKVGVADVTELSTDWLPAGRLPSDHRYEYAVLPGLRQSELGATDSFAVSSRKNVPAGYPTVLLATKIGPVLGTTSEQLTKTSVSA